MTEESWLWKQGLSLLYFKSSEKGATIFGNLETPAKLPQLQRQLRRPYHEYPHSANPQNLHQ